MFDEFTLVLAQGDDPAPNLPKPPGANGAAPVEGQPTEGGDGGGGPPTETRSSPFGGQGFLLIMLVFVVFWIFLMGGNRREKKKRARMLSVLAKGNKVQTVGGIIGTVMEVREKDVVVKVDENSNTRLRFTRAAIQSVLEGDGEG